MHFRKNYDLTLKSVHSTNQYLAKSRVKILSVLHKETAGALTGNPLTKTNCCHSHIFLFIL